MRHYDYLIVGSGLFGAVFAYRARMADKYRNFLLYGIIGGSCAMIDFLAYTVLTHIGLPYLLANVVSVHCGIVCSFMLNSRYNFRVSNHRVVRFMSFYVIGLIGLALSSLLLYLLVQKLVLDELLSKLITVFAVAVVQFLLNKAITFKTK